MKIVFLLVALASVALAAPKWHQLDGYNFDQYAKDFNKSYGAAELSLRKSLFNARLANIRLHNADAQYTWKQGVNQFTDATDEEFKRLRGFSMKQLHAVRESNPAMEADLPSVDLSALPASVDWREKGVITPVKNQASCGSCWTFGTTETVESFYALKYGASKMPVLSEQQIVDCCGNPDDCGGTGGCEGGTAELAMAYLISAGGQVLEKDYAYTGEDGKCRFNNQTMTIGAKLTNFTVLPSNEYAPVMQALANVGPLIINVDASSWSAYESGVYNGCDNKNPDIDHVVQLVGYGHDNNGGDFWIIRNSWTASWGESGYMRLKRNSGGNVCGIDTNPADGTGCKNGPAQVKVCGSCGILYDVSYPVIL